MIMTQQVDGLDLYPSYYDDRSHAAMPTNPIDDYDSEAIDLRAAQRVVKTAYHGRRHVRRLEELDSTSASCPQYLITLDDDSQLLLRLAPPADVRVLQHDRDVLAADVEVLELIRENAPEVPVPDVVLHESGNATLPGTQPISFLLTTHVPGVPLDVARQQQQQLPNEVLALLDYELGRHTRQISRITSSRFGLASSGKRYSTWRAAFLSMFESLLRDAEDLFVSVPYEVLRWHVGRLSAALDEVTVPQLVCCGLSDPQTSVLVDEVTGRLNGLVNFERAVWGDPLMEASFREPSCAFLSGYGGSPLSGPHARARILLYTLYHYLGAVVEVYYHGLNHEFESTARKGLVRCLKSLSEYRG
ncbi:hypothetical protein ABW21_db0201158 [Orbilia brochopaga]|nr:hypothetical protein ABW21_db0201158 [Drechslerella brochopaga]